MKKRLTSFVLAFIIIMGLCIPVSASGTSSKYPGLTQIGNMTAIAAPENGAISPVDAEASDDMPVTYAIRDYVGVREVHITPAIVRISTGAVYTINALERSRYWGASQASQYGALMLSSEEVTSLTEQIIAFVENQAAETGEAWAYVGWWVQGKIALTATLPNRVEYTARSHQTDQEFEKQVLTVSDQSAVLSVSQFFYLPQNYTQYYYVGFSGNFFYTYTSGSNAGKEDGINFTCGVSLNT